MKTIRENVFETNSSSCHCVTIAGTNMLEKYKNNEIVCVHNFGLSEYETIAEVVPDSDFITIEELTNRIKGKLKTINVFSCYEKELNYLTKNISEQLVIDCLKNKDDYSTVIDFDGKSLYFGNIFECMQNIIGEIYYYSEYDDYDPLNDYNGRLSFEGISGPINVIYKHVEC